jgi:hypothetical protein
MKRKNHILFLLRFLWIVLFIWHYSSATMFYHSHFVNGIVIIHSHLYKSSAPKKSPYQSHNHPPSEYVFIEHLNQTNWNNDIHIPEVPEPLYVLNSILPENYISYVYPFRNYAIKLRAPPVA